MSVAVIADAHLGELAAVDELVPHLEHLPGRGCRRLLLLGDLFHVWVGDRRYETPEVARVVPLLRELRREGVAVDYVEGNRDFFLAGSPYADAFDRLGTELAFRVGGRRFLAVHGDGLDARDRQYRFWRWLSKSAVSRFLVLNLPGAMARRAMMGTERRLARTNFRHRLHVPEQSLRRYAARRLREGHDVLLIGHYHEARRWRVEGGELWLMDAWFRSRRVEWIGGGEARGGQGDSGSYA